MKITDDKVKLEIIERLVKSGAVTFEESLKLMEEVEPLPYIPSVPYVPYVPHVPQPLDWWQPSIIYCGDVKPHFDCVPLPVN